MNYVDPLGTNAFAPTTGYPCGPNWATDASLSGPCPGPGYGGIYGEGGGGGSACFMNGINYFTGAPDPACYVPPPPPPVTSAPAPECDPGFLPDSFRVTNFEGYTFSGADINFAARVVFGEASNNVREQAAVADVIYNRVDNSGFKSKGQVAQTLTDVVMQPRQFNAVTPPGPNRRFVNSGPNLYQQLDPIECHGLETAIQAMLNVATNGAATDYLFFAAASSTTQGTLIGKTRFW